MATLAFFFLFLLLAFIYFFTMMVICFYSFVQEFMEILMLKVIGLFFYFPVFEAGSLIMKVNFWQVFSFPVFLLLEKLIEKQTVFLIL